MLIKDDMVTLRSQKKVINGRPMDEELWGRDGVVGWQAAFVVTDQTETEV